jgi:hypothetical protein
MTSGECFENKWFYIEFKSKTDKNSIKNKLSNREKFIIILILSHSTSRH